MKTLKTLVKLNQNKLDKLLKDIQYQEVEQQRIEQNKLVIEQNQKREVKAFEATEFSYMLDRYILNAQNRIKVFDAQLLQINQLITKLRILLHEQYSELKKYEIALKNKHKLSLQKLNKLESKNMDEFNINNFALKRKK